MDDVENIYNEGKLLIRAMDQPRIGINGQDKYYECESWINEFCGLMKDGLSSLSTTLIMPNVGVRTYKNVGFLINSDWTEVTHVAKSDSASSGNERDGDFSSNKADFNTVLELANHIKEKNDVRMNEVNVNSKLDGVVGLFINKSSNPAYILTKIFVAKEVIKSLTGVDYPIYLYDWSLGKLDKIEITKEMEEIIANNLEGDKVLCWPDDVDEAYYIPIEVSQYSK